MEIIARLICREQSPGGRLAGEIIYECPLDYWQDVAGSKLRTRDFLRAVFELSAIYRRYLLPGYNVSSQPPSPTIQHESDRKGRDDVRRAA